MKIKEAVYKEPCKCCGTHSRDIVSPEVFGCDQCQKEISSPHTRERSYLEVIIFYHDSEKDAKHFQFCSWDCVFKFVLAVQQTENKSDYFIDLPHLYCDATDDMSKMPTYDDFVKAINNHVDFNDDRKHCCPVSDVEVVPPCEEFEIGFCPENCKLRETK